jgi:nucleoside 2-deoxyribosyltransferase
VAPGGARHAAWLADPFGERSAGAFLRRICARDCAGRRARHFGALETCMTIPGIYLAGPDVFFPNAREALAAKQALCERYGCAGLPPLDVEIAAKGRPSSASIFERNLALMRRADLVVANLTPFRGISADPGTVFELGWFHGAGKPAYGYSNVAANLEARVALAFTPIANGPGGRRFANDGLSIEGFGLGDNLMIDEALRPLGGLIRPADARDRPIDDLFLFEECLKRVVQAARLAPR